MLQNINSKTTYEKQTRHQGQCCMLQDTCAKSPEGCFRAGTFLNTTEIADSGHMETRGSRTRVLHLKVGISDSGSKTCWLVGTHEAEDFLSGAPSLLSWICPQAFDFFDFCSVPATTFTVTSTAFVQTCSANLLRNVLCVGSSYTNMQRGLVLASALLAGCLTAAFALPPLERGFLKQIHALNRYNQYTVDQNAKSKVTCAGR